MFLFFILCIIQGKSQTLMMDSRTGRIESLNLNLFHQQFSIWFTYYKGINPEIIDLFMIINQGYLIVQIEAQASFITVTFDQNHVTQIENQELLLNGQWIHLVINQNENFLKGEFFIQTQNTQNQTTEYYFPADSTKIQDQQSLIITFQNQFSFYLIYDQETYEIEPIIKSTSLQLLINQYLSPILIYHSDSAIEIFMKKQTQKEYDSVLISIQSEQFSQMQFLDHYNDFVIFVNQVRNFWDSSSRLMSWFRILIKFNNLNVEYEIQFIDEKIEKSCAIMYRPKIFYQIYLNAEKSNYKFLKITSYFNLQNYDFFQENQLLQFKNCDKIKSFFDFESNNCKDYLDQDEVQNIEYNGKISLVQVQKKKSDQYQQIGEAISRQIFSNITSQNYYPLIEQLNNDTNNIFKEPFILYIEKSLVFCAQYYFGQYCKKFVKKCQYAQYDYCQNCDYGYLLIRNRCVKCPQHCIYCTFYQQQYKCLIPKIDYFVTQQHLSKLCKCQFCNIDGNCVTQVKVIDLIKNCMKDPKCILQQCLSESYDILSTQECLIMPNDHQEQTFYYSFYSDKKNQYRLLNIQFILIQNHKLYGKILTNQIISNYYLYMQINQILYNFQENFNQFKMTEYYYQSVWSLECREKSFDSKGYATCKEYYHVQNKKCHKSPCFYRLIIRDILYYMGVRNYIEYNNYYYSSIFKLLQSVKNIGILFKEVYLNITFISQSFKKDQKWSQKIDLSNTNLVSDTNHPRIAVELNFQQTKSINFQIKLKIIANQIILQNQTLNYDLQLNLRADYIFIANLIINEQISLKFSQGIFCSMIHLEVNNNLTIQLKNFTSVEIEKFSSIYEPSLCLLFENIDRISLINLDLSIQNIKYKNLFHFSFVNQIRLDWISLKFHNISGQNIITLQICDYLKIENLSVIGKILEDSAIILLYLIGQTHMSNFFNIFFYGIWLSNNNLMLLESELFSYIELNISNIGCYFQQDSQIIVIKGLKSKIYQLRLSNISIENNFHTILIHVQNFAQVIIQEAHIFKIQQQIHQSQSFIFSLDQISGRIIQIDVTECDNIVFLFSKAKCLYISQLNYFNNSYHSILELLFVDSIISLTKNQSVFFAKTQLKSIIEFQNISFNFQQAKNYFYFQGSHLIVQLINVFITYDQIQYDNNQDAVFIINLHSFQVLRLFVKNLCQSLFYLSSTEDIDMYDLLLINTKFKHKYFLFYVLDSKLFLDNIKLFSIENSYGLIKIDQKIETQIHIKNFWLKDAKNVSKVFEIILDSSYSYLMVFSNVLINNCPFKDIFHFKFKEQPQKIFITNLFLNRADNLFLIDRGQYIFEIINSIIRIQNLNLNFNNATITLKLISCAIIIDGQFNIPQIRFDDSYIYNNKKNSIVIDIKFNITLSLNRVDYLRSIRLQDSNEKECQKFMLSENGSMNYYFYVPSGQKLSDYKILNFSSLQQRQIYLGFYLIVQGFKNDKCTQQQIYKDQLVNQQDFDVDAIEEEIYDLNKYVFTISPLNSNYTVFKITCLSNINSQKIQLQYNVKAFPCQQGEYLFKNQCLECKISQNLYSVNQNSDKCISGDYNQIRQIKKGLLDLNQRYWRYSYTSNIIEFCDSNNCNGGWIPGDQSCIKSRIGALCQECDLYNLRGDGSFTSSNQQCLQCESINVQFVFRVLFMILWQLLLIIYQYYSNQRMSEQFLMFKVGFRQFYQILQRQSINLPWIIIKMFANYLFMLYIIKANFNFTGQSFLNNINLINSPGLITKTQIDCILFKLLRMNIIYTSFIFQITQVFFIISLSFLIYLIMIQIRKTRFNLGLVLYATWGIVVYNLNIILFISFNLLSYKVASGIKWIRYNMQYQFFTEKHISMIQFIIPITLVFLIIPFLFPLAIKFLSVVNRQVKRIYTIYYKQYKTQFIFWEYLILYIKYTIMIFQIFDDQSIQYGIFIIWFMCLLSQNLKPYYWQNLNMFEQNLFVLYGIQMSLLHLSSFKDEIVICLNLLIFTYVAQKAYISINIFYKVNIIELKLIIVQKFNWIRKFSGLDKNQRLLKNKLSLIYLVRTKILKKLYLASTIHQVLSIKEQEIEMPMIVQQIGSQIAQSRKENHKI